MKNYQWLVILRFLPALTSYCSDQGKEYKLLIDNDAGGDDAFGIFIALLYEKYCDGPKVIGLTTGNGNTNENNVFINDQKVLHLAKRTEVPIYRGAKEALVIEEKITDFFGKDGLGENNYTFSPIEASDTNALDALISLSKIYKDKLIVIALKSLTNIALAIKLDPDFLSRIGHLYIGASYIYGEQYPDPEFNAFMDVEAYFIVMKHATPDKVTLLPFSQVLISLNISKEWRTGVFGSIDSDIVRAVTIFESIGLSQTSRWESLDPAMVAAVVKPELISEIRYTNNTIRLCGDKRGTTQDVFVDKTKANVKMIYSMKKESYMDFLIELFTKDANG